MSGLLQAIRQQLLQLHPKERALAEYIVDKPADVVRMGITELAAGASVSPGTVTRFCKLFHQRSFSAFKTQLATELGTAYAVPAAADTYQDIVAGNSLRAIAEAVEASHLRSIADTTRLLDMERLEAAVTAISAARQIDLYGMATSGIVAQDFYQKLVRIGRRTTAFTDPHLQITSAACLTEADVAIAISYSGETPEIIDALRCAKDNGATTISLTKQGPNMLASHADIPLFASALEAGMRRGDLASRIATMHVVDILFMGVVSKDFDNTIPHLEETYRMVQQYRKKRNGGGPR